MSIVLDVFTALNDRAFHLFAYKLLCIINPQSLLSVLVHLALMGRLCSFPHWASQVQTCLILMSLPIPIKRLSESLLPCQSLSLWSSFTPAPNIWWADKTSSSVSAVNHVRRWQWPCKDGAVKVSSGQYTPAVTDQYKHTSYNILFWILWQKNYCDSKFWNSLTQTQGDINCVIKIIKAL